MQKLRKYMKRLRNFIAVFGFTAVLAVGASAQTPLTSLEGGSVNVQGQKGRVVVLAVGAS